MNANRPNDASGTGKAKKRRPHSIRFFDPEWERIAAFAGDRGLTPAEFVRFATLAAIEDGDGRGNPRLVPLIETTFTSTTAGGGRDSSVEFAFGDRQQGDSRGRLVVERWILARLRHSAGIAVVPDSAPCLDVSRIRARTFSSAMRAWD